LHDANNMNQHNKVFYAMA